jgi:hypothetical protein
MAMALQAACKENNGFAKLTVIMSVHGNRPVLWCPLPIQEIEASSLPLPAYQLLKLHPKRVAEFKMSSSTIAALMTLMD